MKYISQLLLISLYIILCSCIDEINIDTKSKHRETLVVNAWLGADNLNSYVEVLKTVSYDELTTYPIALDQVYVEREDGKTIKFTQAINLTYVPAEEFSPRIGEKYRLNFSTLDGEQYESSWETIPPKSQIENITYKAFEKLVITSTPSGYVSQKKTFAEILLNFKDGGVENGGYLINTSGISELFTASFFENCLCTCYQSTPNIYQGLNIISNENFRDQNYTHQIGEIPLSHAGRYYVKGRIRTITKFGKDFYIKVDQQQRKTGSIFDPSPSRIKGNIINKNSPGEIILGGFFVYNENEFDQMFFRSEIRRQSMSLNHFQEPIPSVSFSCNEFYTNATPFKPAPF